MYSIIGEPRVGIFFVWEFMAVSINAAASTVPVSLHPHERERERERGIPASSSLDPFTLPQGPIRGRFSSALSSTTEYIGFLVVASERWPTIPRSRLIPRAHGEHGESEATSGFLPPKRASTKESR